MKFIIVLISLFCCPYLLFSKSVSLEETKSNIIVSSMGYNIDIKKNGFNFKLSFKNQVVLSSSNNPAFFITQNGKEYTFGNLMKYEQFDDSILFHYATNEANIDATIKLFIYSDNFKINIKVNRDCENVGCNIQLQNGASWYGGNITSAQKWPSNSESFEVDPFYSSSNQTSPVWICSKGVGIFVNTFKTMGYSFNKKYNHVFSFHVKNTNELNFVVTVGSSITDSYKSLIEIIGKPQIVPPLDYFANSIFNSWIEFKKNVNQSGLINYSEQIRKNKMPCSLIEIDDMWTCFYGEFEFDRKKFPDPKEMILRLNRDNFKVALWVTPFIEKNASTFNYLASKGFLIIDPLTHLPYFTKWWNGEAALIDFSNPEAYHWFLNQLNNLKDKYNVSGFKLDAGDADFLDKPFKSFEKITANQYTDLFASIGKYFEINELRVSWLTQSFGLVQRLRDKSSDWSVDKGIGSIISNGLTEGLIGYPYFCPDMIGGGEIGSFTENNDRIDNELYIRWTQVSAFMPMMQYSFAPWRMDSTTLSICLKYSLLHKQLGDFIYSLAKESVITGEPIARSLFYQFPEDSLTYSISDQFMLGDKFLIAPVLLKGNVTRDIYLPKGIWIDYWNGDIIKGGQTLKNYSAPIEKLPVFINIL